MNHSDIAALMKGAAPAIRDFVASAMQPLVDRISELERQLESAQAVDHKDAIASAVADAVANIPAAPAGKDADMAEVERMIAVSVGRAVSEIEPREPDAEQIRSMIAEEVAKLPPAEPGKPAEPPTADELRDLMAPLVKDAVGALPKAQDGQSVTVEDLAPVVADEVAKAMAAIPAPKDGAPGKLPIAKTWSDGVHYEGDVRTHNGALWQAVKDTGREPGNEDWICLAAAGEAGRDADQIDICGTYDPGKTYRRLNIVALNGGAFMAKSDDPGECPGEGWQVIAMRGKPGQPGQSIKGDPGRGIKGEPGPAVVSLHVDGDGLLTLTNGDGTSVECDFYPLLSKVR